MKKLLLVEDDASLGATLRDRLAKEGYQVNWSDTLARARREIQSGSFDLIILDVNLPDGSGFDFARNVRKQSATPFLFVTAMNTAEHRLEGYEIGAEEFIPKPFHLKELLMRIRHVLGTHAIESAPNTTVAGKQIRVGERAVDYDARAIVLPGGGKEFLATRDFELLKLLIDSAPKVVSRDEILDSIWGEDKFPSHRTVDNAIVRLRQLLADEGGQVIRSVRGIGYQWIA